MSTFMRETLNDLGYEALSPYLIGAISSVLKSDLTDSKKLDRIAELVSDYNTVCDEYLEIKTK